jgi:ketosteroid isomerase-like protein
MTSHAMSYPSDFSTALFSTADAGDIDGFAALLAENVSFRFGNAEPIEGRSNAKQAFTEFLATLAGIHHEVLEEWRTGDVVVQQMTVTYTRHDGKRVTIPACNVLRLDGELVVDYQIYADLTPVYALG